MADNVHPPASVIGLVTKYELDGDVLNLTIAPATGTPVDVTIQRESMLKLDRHRFWVTLEELKAWLDRATDKGGKVQCDSGGYGNFSFSKVHDVPPPKPPEPKKAKK